MPSKLITMYHHDENFWIINAENKNVHWIRISNENKNVHYFPRFVEAVLGEKNITIFFFRMIKLYRREQLQ